MEKRDWIGWSDDGFDVQMFRDEHGVFRKRAIDKYGNSIYIEQRHVEQARNVPLPVNPHYSNPEYSRGGTQLVFGVEKYPGVERVNWEYSDRLWQFDGDKHDAAWDATKKMGNTAKRFQAYLTAYYGKPVYLFGILAGVNVSNGYPYQVFGFVFPEEVK